VSVANAFVFPDHALVGVDTEMTRADKSIGCTSKLQMLPHMPALYTCRGNVAFGAMIGGFMVAAGGDFDQLAGNLTRFANIAFANVEKTAAKENIALAQERQELLLVGYSPADDRIVGKLAILEHGGESFTCVDVGGADSPGIYLAPHWGDCDEIDAHTLDREEMIAIAMEQSRLLREREPIWTASGGRLIIAELRRDRIAIEIGPEFPHRA
jgi:hypothetical protein